MEGKPFSAVGEVIDRLAREKKNIRQAARIASFVKEYARENGLDEREAVGRSTIGNYLYGRTSPSEEWLTLFALAFELSYEEMGELAFANSFRFPAAA